MVANNTDAVHIKWNAPADDTLKNLTYGVYYGIKMDEFFESKSREHLRSLDASSPPSYSVSTSIDLFYLQELASRPKTSPQK